MPGGPLADQSRRKSNARDRLARPAEGSGPWAISPGMAITRPPTMGNAAKLIPPFSLEESTNGFEKTIGPGMDGLAHGNAGPFCQHLEDPDFRGRLAVDVAGIGLSGKVILKTRATLKVASGRER